MKWHATTLIRMPKAMEIMKSTVMNAVFCQLLKTGYILEILVIVETLYRNPESIIAR